jgi:hypothetical protein
MIADTLFSCFIALIWLSIFGAGYFYVTKHSKKTLWDGFDFLFGIATGSTLLIAALTATLLHKVFGVRF